MQRICWRILTAKVWSIYALLPGVLLDYERNIFTHAETRTVKILIPSPWDNLQPIRHSKKIPSAKKAYSPLV